LQVRAGTKRYVIERLESRWLLTVWYVNQADGSNSYNGQSLTVAGGAGPFATISAAASVAQPGDTVMICAGTYHETVTPTNSGTSSAPITYQAYNNQSVTISGADPITGWTYAGGSIYTAPMSWTQGGLNDQVFVDGQALNQARWPSTSFDFSHPTLAHAGAGSTGVVNNNVLNNTLVDPNLTQPDGFWTGATIVIGAGPDWIFETDTVTSYTRGVLHFNGTTNSIEFAATPGNPYYLIGKSGALTAAGEYFRDPTTGNLSVWTPNGDSPASHDVEARHRQWAFDLSGKSYINITGLNFFAAGLNSSSTSSNLTINGINATWPAYFATWGGFFSANMLNNGIILNGNNDTVENSIIGDTSGNGVVIIGNNETVTNNYIHDVDLAGIDNSAITSFDSSNPNGPFTSNDTITYNTLADSARGLIIHRGMLNSHIAYNRLWNAMLQTTDGGAIYTFQNYNTGDVLDHNIVSDTVNYYSGNPAVAYFEDGSSTGFTYYDNVAWNTAQGFKVNSGATANYYYNNTVANSFSSAYLTGTLTGGAVENNIFTSSVTNTGTGVSSNNLLSPTDPKFTDPGSANFTLQSTSPAINAGVAIAPYTNGYVGTAPDEGAYEYGATPWTAGASSTITAAVPAAPTKLLATVISTSQVNLSWTNNATNATSYVIERSADGATFAYLASVSSTTNTYSDTTANLGTYYYRVRAYNGTIDSASTPWISIGTGHNPYQNIPANSFDAKNGFNVSGTVLNTWNNGNWVQYNNVAFGQIPATQFTIDLGTPAQYAGQQIQVRLDSVTGTLIGTLTTTATGSFGTLVPQTASITPTTGTHTVYLVGVGSAGIGNFDYFTFAGTPILATPAAASPSQVTTGNTTTLSVLGNDGEGESNLTYTWTAISPPASVTFSANGTNAAKNTTVTFSSFTTAPYTFQVTITNLAGLSTTSQVSVTLGSQVATSITLAPASTTLAANGSTAFTAVVKDQFGNIMSAPVSWHTTLGTIDSAGNFTAPATAGLAVVSASSASLYATANVTINTLPAPLAYYQFEEGSGTTANDSSGNGYTGTLSGTVSYSTSGMPGDALNFTSGTVNLGSPTGLNISGKITLSAWIKPTSSSGTQDIIGRSYTSSPSAETELRIANGQYQIETWNGSTYSAAGGAVSSDLNTWVFLTGIYDGTAWRLYRDGVQIASTTTSQGALSVSLPWTIGSSDVSSSHRYYTGLMDEVRIYNTALTPTQVATLDDTYTPPTVTTAAVAGTVTHGAAALSVLGASVLGASSLSYQWNALGTPPGNVTFSANGTNTANNTTATFSAPGTYNLIVTITDSDGQAVTSSVPVIIASPSWLGSASVASWNPSASVLTVNGPTTITGDPGADAPIIQASGSSASVTFTTTTATDIHIGGLSLASGARALVSSLGATRSMAKDNFLVIGSSTATSAPPFSIDSTSTLDLADNDLAILYGSGTSPLPQVQQDLQTGSNYNASTGAFQWNGTGMISSVAPTTGGATGLGYATESELSAISQAAGGSAITTFDGQSLGANAVLVKYTLMGDSTLSGTVSGTDYNAVLANYDTNGDWSQGNFHYGGTTSGNTFTNGQIAGQDYNTVLSNYDGSLAAYLPGGTGPALAPAAAVAVKPGDSTTGSSATSISVHKKPHSPPHRRGTGITRSIVPYRPPH
jgi:hypothetical protein